MKPNCQERAAPANTADRRLIRVELPSDDAGITEALRRAFEAEAPRRSEFDFDALLNRLNQRLI